MDNLRMALLAALPWEYTPFKRTLGPWACFSQKPFQGYALSFADKELLLVETGMGRERIREAMDWIGEAWMPHVLVSFGFCGGLHNSMGVGEVFLCRSFRCADPTSPSTSPAPYMIQGGAALNGFCRAHLQGTADLVTTLRWESKASFRAGMPADPAAVDMESYFVAEFAEERKLPLVCIRSVSDTLDQELGFRLEDVSNDPGRISVRKALRAIMANPSILRHFHASWRRSRKAAKALGRALAAFTALSSEAIREISPGARVMKGDISPTGWGNPSGDRPSPSGRNSSACRSKKRKP